MTIVDKAITWLKALAIIMAVQTPALVISVGSQLGTILAAVTAISMVLVVVCTWILQRLLREYNCTVIIPSKAMAWPVFEELASKGNVMIEYTYRGEEFRAAEVRRGTTSKDVAKYD